MDGVALYAQRQLSLARSTFSARDKEAITRFLNNLQAQGVGELRLSKYISNFTSIKRLTSKALVDLQDEDLDAVLVAINTSKWRAWTKHDYQVALKKFYRFLDGDAKRAGRVRVVRPADKLIPENEVLTDEDITRLEAACRSVREQVVVRCLFESGGAAKEFTDLKVGDVTDRPPFLIFHFHGTKTPYRNGRVPVINRHAVDLFRAYLREHPKKSDSEAPLWLNFHGDALEPANLAKFLRGLGQRAGVKKRINPHWFRHSKITQLRANGASDSATRTFARWSKKSNMLSVYDHSGEQALMGELQKMGATSPEEFLEGFSDEVVELIRKDKDLMRQIVRKIFDEGKMDLLKQYARLNLDGVRHMNFPGHAEGGI
ncbi:tyrosine-type recombinase/integrase [Candidatus Micrarchaeota archaeon]|nr:tyrosine-type recombinase/integrase [Candidatus Micrarchaeota archaeon]